MQNVTSNSMTGKEFYLVLFSEAHIQMYPEFVWTQLRLLVNIWHRTAGSHVCGVHFIEGHLAAAAYRHFWRMNYSIVLKKMFFKQDSEYGYNERELLHILTERLQSK
jgi:hypothetical protein